jgi:hypothetical protein
VGVSISLEKNFYRLPCTPPLSGRLIGPSRGGFKEAKVNLPLLDGRLRLFLEGKEDWLEEGLLVSVKKKIKEEGL